MVFSYRWWMTISFIVFLNIHSANAQITFHASYGGENWEIGNSVQQCADEGFIVTGYTSSNEMFDFNMYLLKTDANGEPIWSKAFGGAGEETGNSVKQCVDNGFIVAGRTTSHGSTLAETYLVRTDPNGDLMWAKTFGGIGEGRSVQQCADNGFIVAGRISSIASDSSDVNLIRTDADGELLWAKTYGGTDDDQAYSVQQCSDGGFIITGYTLSYGAGNEDVYLIRTDPAGDLMWTRTFGGTEFDIGKSVQQTPDGGFIITGYTTSFGSGFYDVFLIQTDANGDLMWAKTYGGDGFDIGHSVQQCTEGGFIVCGYTGSFSSDGKIYLLKINPAGELMWSKTYGETSWDEGFSVQQCADGGFIVSGITSPFSGEKLALIKTDASGNTRCDTNEVITIVQNAAMLVGSGGTVSTSGVLTSIIAEENDAESSKCIQCDIVTAFGYSDSALFVHFYDSSTQTVNSWDWDFGDSTTSTLQNPTHVYSSAGTYNVCLEIFGACFELSRGCKLITVSSDFQLPSDSIKIFPNPNNGLYTLDLVLNIKSDLLINVYRISGQLIFSEKINDIDGAYSRQIDLSDQYRGIYYAQVITVRGVLTAKIVIQY